MVGLGFNVPQQDLRQKKKTYTEYCQSNVTQGKGLLHIAGIILLTVNRLFFQPKHSSKKIKKT